MRYSIPKYVYLDYSEHKNYAVVWNRIRIYLTENFGEPSDPRERDLTARWCEGLMKMTSTGCPRGIYMRESDDLLAFLLKYPNSSVRGKAD